MAVPMPRTSEIGLLEVMKTLRSRSDGYFAHRGLSWILDKPPADQAGAIRRGTNTDPRWLGSIPKLAFGMRSERHSPIQERLANRTVFETFGSRAIELKEAPSP